MGITIRETIAADSQKAYDEFMAGTADTSFMSLEHKDNVIIIYEHHGEDDKVIRSETFAASSLASSFVEQEHRKAVEMGLFDDSTEVAGTTNSEASVETTAQ